MQKVLGRSGMESLADGRQSDPREFADQHFRLGESREAVKLFLRMTADHGVKELVRVRPDSGLTKVSTIFWGFN